MLSERAQAYSISLSALLRPLFNRAEESTKMSLNETQIRRGAALVLSIAAGLTLWLGANAPNVQVRYAVDEFLAESDPQVAADQQIRRRFRISERPTIFLLAQSEKLWSDPQLLEQLAHVHSLMTQNPEVLTVTSLGQLQTLASTPDGYRLEPLATAAKGSPELTQALLDLPLTRPALLSRDGHWTTFSVELKTWNQIEKTATDLVSIARENLPGVAVSASGVPLIQNELTSILTSELKSLGLIGLFLSTAALILFFRGVFVLVLTGLISVASVLATVGAMAALGLEMGVLSISLPILLIVQAVSLVLHSVLHYMREHHQLEAILTSASELKSAAVISSFRKLLVPNFLGSLTTSIGFLTLTPSSVRAMSEFGWVVAISSMGVWLLATFILYPALLLGPLPVRRELWSHRARWSLWFTLKPKLALFAVAVLTLVSLAKGFDLKTAHRLFDDLDSSPESKVAAQTMDKKLGGLVPVEIQLGRETGSWLEPDQLERVKAVLTQLRSQGGVVSVTSPSDVLDFALAGFKDNRSLSVEGQIAELLALFELGSTNPLKPFVRDDGRTIRITTRLSDQLGDAVEQNLLDIERLIQERLPEATVQMGGFGAYIHKMNRELSLGLVQGFWVALAFIALLLLVIYRSLRWTLIAVLPNLFPPVLLLGLLTWFNIELKPAVAIVFAIALGFAFNNTMYILQSLLHLRARNPQFFVTAESVRVALWKDGQACFVSTLVLICGFLGLCLSQFGASQSFGLAMVYSMAAGLLGDLVMLPAFLTVFPNSLNGGFLKRANIASVGVGKILISVGISVGAFHLPSLAQAKAPSSKARTAKSESVKPLETELDESLEKFPELKEWAKEIERQHSARDESVILELINEEPDGEKESRRVELKRLSLKSKTKKGSRSKDAKQSLLLRILEPKNLRGTAILIVSQSKGPPSRWIYVPSTKQVRRIVSSDESSSKLLGSEVTSTDFDLELYRGSNVAKVETAEGKIRIETKLNPKSAAYSKCVGLFHQDSKLLDRSECFDRAGVKAKSVEVLGYQKLKGGIARPKEVKIANLNTGRITRLVFGDYKVNSGLSQAQFTPEALKD